MAPGTRFLVEDITREGCDDMEDIKCMEQVGPVELVAQARGKYLNYYFSSAVCASVCLSECLSVFLQKKTS